MVVDLVKRRVVARTENSRKHVTEELLVVVRSADVQGNPKVDYHLSNAPEETPLEELARVATAEHRIEECIKRSKSEAGMADYEVRTWWGWHHHQTLSLIATWFLVCEARRGKKWTPAITVPQIRQGLAMLLHRACRCGDPDRVAFDRTRRLQRNESARLYHHKRRNLLAPLRIHQRT